jgi:hypothetical protein
MGLLVLNIHDNLIFNVDDYSIDVRQVNAISRNNTVSKNICSTPIRLEGSGNFLDSVFTSDNVIFKGTQGTLSKLNFSLRDVTDSKYTRIHGSSNKNSVNISLYDLRNLNVPSFIKSFINPITQSLSDNFNKLWFDMMNNANAYGVGRIFSNLL